VIFIFLEWVEPTWPVFVRMLVVCSAEDLNLALLTCPTSYLPTLPRCYQYLLGNHTQISTHLDAFMADIFYIFGTLNFSSAPGGALTHF
jgi:hypothetical protein